MYFSKKKTWEEFRLRMLRLLKENQTLQAFVKTNRSQSGSQAVLTKDDLRVWSTTLNVTDKLQLDQSSLEIEGFCLDKFINHPIEQILSGLQQDDLDPDVLLIELNDPT